MSYNQQELPKYINTAGKITVITAMAGVFVFIVAFLLNIGASELQQASAQNMASTSVTVLNTPPEWTVDAQEDPGSSTTTPTNSGDQVTWTAVGTDNNNEDYYLLICSTADAPSSTPNGAPTCNGGIQWAVSASTTSGTQATAATTTQEAWAESNDWYAWLCDGINDNPRCTVTSRQGSGTTSSPFIVNHRPSFSAFSDNSEIVNAEPGDTVTFYATTSDSDVLDSPDTKQLIVCSTNSYNTVTNTCDATTLATSSFTTATSITATYQVVIPTRDDTYGAWGFVIDEHGHEASGGSQQTNTVLTVYNTPPSILNSDIVINNGSSTLSLTQEAGETTGFTLSFTATDNNSCKNATNTDEIVGYGIVFYRSGIGSSTCDTTGANYDPNNCYDSGVPTTTWNISCTASSTELCTATTTERTFDCTFPLWYVADPTSQTASESFYWNENWLAAVAPVDDDSATGTLTDTNSPVELYGFLSFSLDTIAIPYGDLEPGQFNDPLSATTTLRATGNIGLDQELSGEAMCDYFTGAVTCSGSNVGTSTIAESYQVFGTSSISYSFASTTLGNTLSSTTPKELEVNIPKPTATSSQTSTTTYWGIHVPASITKAGVYTGENTIYGVAGEPTEW